MSKDGITELKSTPKLLALIGQDPLTVQLLGKTEKGWYTPNEAWYHHLLVNNLSPWMVIRDTTTTAEASNSGP